MCESDEDDAEDVDVRLRDEPKDCQVLWHCHFREVQRHGEGGQDPALSHETRHAPHFRIQHGRGRA